MRRLVVGTLDLLRFVVWIGSALATLYLVVTRLLAGDVVGFIVGLVVIGVAYAVLMFVYAVLRAPFTTNEEYWRVKAENDQILGR